MKKLKIKKTFIIQLCQVFALWKTPALYPLGVFVMKKNAMETNAELRYGHSIITILLRSNISGCYTTLFYAKGEGGKIRCVTSCRVT